MINLDNASTTKPYNEVVNEIALSLTEDYLNMGAKYSQAKIIEKKTNLIRTNFLKAINAKDGDIIFCPSATSANNLILRSINIKNGGRILISEGEHSSVYETSKELIRQGAKLDYIPLTKNGQVDIEKFKTMLSEDVCFVSTILVSNETGAINNLKEIVKIAKQINPKCLVHTDAVQALGKIKIDAQDLGVDFITISAHKIYGPKGIGALYAKNIEFLKPLIFGGGQEYNLVSGTENFAYISGFNTALKLTTLKQEENYKIVKSYKEEFLSALNAYKVNYIINSPEENCSPYILNLSFKNVRGEVLLHALSQMDILIANGSACSSKKRGNRVLEAMGKNKDEIDGAVRISFSPYEKYDFNYIASCFYNVIEQIKY
ncbi:MAG: cysteine desulfurase [Clostridia bacterium]|nr:cysteine desulfurase [Clostridia bacterium]